MQRLAPAKRKKKTTKKTTQRERKYGSSGFKKLLPAQKNEVVNVSDLGLGEPCGCKFPNTWG